MNETETTDDRALLARWRADTPAAAHRIHLNNAGAALPPQSVLDAEVSYLEREAEAGGYELEAAEETATEAAYGHVAAQRRDRRERVGRLRPRALGLRFRARRPAGDDARGLPVEPPHVPRPRRPARSRGGAGGGLGRGRSRSRVGPRARRAPALPAGRGELDPDQLGADPAGRGDRPNLRGAGRSLPPRRLTGGGRAADRLRGPALRLPGRDRAQVPPRAARHRLPRGLGPGARARRLSPPARHARCRLDRAGRLRAGRFRAPVRDLGVQLRPGP